SGEIALTIDSDTQGEPGTPPITDTVLKKIRACDIFLADMTFVAQTGEKLIPNPNVMGEYGYALHAKGTRRILLVMNEAYGSPDELPFDLHHLRHPEGYSIAEDVTDGPRRAARKELGRRLADYIKLIAKEVAAEAAQTEAERRKALSDTWWTAVQQRQVNDRPALVSPPSVLVHVVPSASLTAGDLDPRAVKPFRGLLKIDDDADATIGADGHHWWAHGAKRNVSRGHNPEAYWYGRLIQPGIAEWEINIGERIENDPTIVVKGKYLEWLIVNAADRSLELAAGLGLTGPSLVGVMLYELEDIELSGPYKTRRLAKPSVVLPVSIVPAGLLKSGDHLRQTLDRLWMSAGFEDGSPSYRDGHWLGYERLSP
ncbi:MAG TPA: hypothetical protein VF470_01730, partial [Sphingomicrobium sp.]